MSWFTEPMLALDLESTGVDQDNDRIATACAAIVHNGEVTYQREWMIAIDVDMPAEASAVNKLTTEHLRANGRPAADVMPEIVKALRYAITSRMPIVAFNGAFDLTFCDREVRRWYGQSLTEAIGHPVSPVLDPFVIWKAVEKFRKGGRKLTDACAAFGVDLGENAHEAAADAIAAARVMVALGRANRSIAGMTLPDLHAAQIGWRKEQCDSLRAYFDKKGQAHDGIDPSWPLRELVDVAVPA